KQKNNLDTIIWEIASKNLKKEMLEEQFKRQTENERGVKTIIDSQKALVGVYGTVAQNISTKTEHELAISTALAKGINNIIVKNNQAAENCINFLKKNNAGVATFLPIENLQAKSIKPEFYDVLKELEGFVGVANELVKINVNYKISIDTHLGNKIIAKN
ncbi:chromosome segregation protein SMC, partial [Ureaplasma urealyticum]